MLLHYRVKIETPKMHVNTTSAFYVNYKIAVTCIEFHWQFRTTFWWITQMNIYVRALCLKCPPPTHTYLRWSCYWSFAVSMTSWLESNQVCIKRFHRSSTSWIFISYSHCCTTPEISKFKAHDDPGPLWRSYDHLMQLSLVISHCNITFSVFWLSQGSVATLIR